MKIPEFITSFIKTKAAGQIMRYLITGVCSAAIEFSLLFVFKGLMGLSVVVANSIALSIVFWFNFLMNRIWSFKSKMKLSKQLGMYSLLFLFNLGASDLIMYLLTDRLSMQYLLAKVFATGTVVCWNFVIYKKVIYK
ncbi:MAG: GtrA family protein [Clostridiaceae bacterium]|jgi:putative flippase GtrA|nr:GtrA family protein [Clostridiaceae bacterium]